MREFGPSWARGDDGLYFRSAARVIPCDSSQRILLVRGHDEHDRQRSWWFTIGGGIDAGESVEDAAVRELREETGISMTPSELIGPVIHRNARLDFCDVTARQEEWYFLARIDANGLDIDYQHWTDHEHQTLDEIRWWDIRDLEAESKISEIFPKDLVTYLGQWINTGWDGNLIMIDDEFPPSKHLK